MILLLSIQFHGFRILSVSSASEPAITVGGGNGRQSLADSNRKQAKRIRSLRRKAFIWDHIFFDWIEIRYRAEDRAG